MWLKLLYLAGWIACFAIRWPWQKRWRANTFRDDRAHGLEKALLAAMFLTMMVIPLLHALTPWLSLADYRLPRAAGIAGIVLFAVAVWLFWRAHRDLGANWSPTLQIRERHELVTSGIYARIRHPMYAAIWLWALAAAAAAAELDRRASGAARVRGDVRLPQPGRGSDDGRPVRRRLPRLRRAGAATAAAAAYAAGLTLQSSGASAR